MIAFSAFRTGLVRAFHMPRIVLFAWLVNLAFGLILAVPMLQKLDGAIRGTVMEEPLLERMDENWVQTFKTDNETSEIVTMLDYSILGYAPFLRHSEVVMSGGIVRPLGMFLKGIITDFELQWTRMGFVSWLGLLYVVVGCILSAGFISAFRGEYPPTIAEFLSSGMISFGPFFRLAVVSLILNYLFFVGVVDWLNRGIPSWTENSPSETTPFILYMVRNAFVFLVLVFFTISADYAKVRIVAESRLSALAAFGSGVIFAVRRFWTTFSLAMLFALLTFAAMGLYGFFESAFPQNGYWSILLLVLLQQLFMAVRMFIRAATYAGELEVYSGTDR
ncbi:MAG: hypothetical protein A3C56_03275 [Ignavibacteria bacterium RIFCSPHIGHO2_02_FULL_56_12]|nr:MAG: hypothetical protein A3C56_03275 [Ignavibacteria bacterium RIFCSPHIGHO2_02_FULL_56_12]